MSETMLIYGISGVIGRSLAEAASNAGYCVFATYNSSIAPETLELMRKRKVTLYKADLTNSTHVYHLAREVRPDIAVMLAAHAKNNPTLGAKVFEQNRKMTHNVGESLRRLPDPKTGKPGMMIFASTVLVTGPQDGSKDIDEIPAPSLPEPAEDDHYVESKIWGEHYMDYLLTAGDGQNLDTRTVRFGNVTGSGRENILLECQLAAQVPAIQSGQQDGFELFNKLAALDLSHADDAAQGILAVVQNGHPGLITNIASGKEITAEMLAKQIGYAAGLGMGIPVRSTRTEKEGHARFSNDVLRSLGWKRQYDVPQTVAKFYDWYKTQAAKGDLRFLDDQTYPAMSPYRNLYWRRYFPPGESKWKADLRALILQIEGKIPSEW